MSRQRVSSELAVVVDILGSVVVLICAAYLMGYRACTLTHAGLSGMCVCVHVRLHVYVSVCVLNLIKHC